MRNGKYELVIAPQEYTGKKYRGRYAYEHHVVWWKKTGELPPEGFIVHHKNEDTRDNRFSNLRLMPAHDHNVMHSTGRKGVQRCGGENSNAKFTDAQVRKLRKQYSLGNVTLKEIIEHYEISWQTAQSMIEGTTYSNILKQPLPANHRKQSNEFRRKNRKYHPKIKDKKIVCSFCSEKFLVNRAEHRWRAKQGQTRFYCCLSHQAKHKWTVVREKA